MSALSFKRDAEGHPLWHAPLPADPPAWGSCQLCGEAWPCAVNRAQREPIPITGVWLRDGVGEDAIEVLIERDGEWITVIEERTGGLLSHIVEVLGMSHGSPDRLGAKVRG